MGSPMRCAQDGHTYHLSLNERGDREIKVTARALQYARVETF
jgi:hypothetical protein